jgi:hypothetical protein
VTRDERPRHGRPHDELTPPGAVRPWAPLVGVQGIVIGASASDPAQAVDTDLVTIIDDLERQLGR